jgi:hypothetical protein
MSARTYSTTVAFLIQDLDGFREMLDRSVQGTLTLEERQGLVPLAEALAVTLARLRHYGVAAALAHGGPDA